MSIRGQEQPSRDLERVAAVYFKRPQEKVTASHAAMCVVSWPPGDVRALAMRDPLWVLWVELELELGEVIQSLGAQRSSLGLVLYLDVRSGASGKDLYVSVYIPWPCVWTLLPRLMLSLLRARDGGRRGPRPGGRGICGI